jgi:adenylate cyclase
VLAFGVSGKLDQEHFDHACGPIEFGRGPRKGSVARFVLEDPSVAEDHVRVEELVDGLVRITSLGKAGRVLLHDNSVIAPRQSRDLPIPVVMTIGQTLVNIDVADEAAFSTIGGPSDLGGSRAVRLSLADLGPSPTMEQVARLLEGLIVDQSAVVGSADFFAEAARAAVDLVGLDRAYVLLLREDGWERVAGHPSPEGRDPIFSRTILRRVVQRRRSYFNSAAWTARIGSLDGLEAVVASPIQGPDGRVIGAVYGSRGRSIDARPAIDPSQAAIVQLLATYLGARLARQELDREANRLRQQFEQFFSPELADALQRDETLLVGRQREVTVMFADIRGFSGISERLKDRPQAICELVGAVMDRLTECIRDTGGVVVDYMGDGLMALWNALGKQDDHAALACRAALGMLRGLPSLSDTWSQAVGGPLGIGIGINTGPAVVGNTGSRHKFKYGALGHTVNLASRVEGATKQLGIPTVITGSTRSRLGGAFATRRLCRARVVGIDDPVELYELHSDEAEPGWGGRRDTFEAALGLFEAGDLPGACRAVHSLLAGQAEDSYDIPSLELIARAVQHLRSPSGKFDPVLVLSTK